MWNRGGAQKENLPAAAAAAAKVNCRFLEMVVLNELDINKLDSSPTAATFSNEWESVTSFFRLIHPQARQAAMGRSRRVQLLLLHSTRLKSAGKLKTGISLEGGGEGYLGEKMNS